MPEHTGRSFICAVAAVDLVEYSMKDVTDQLRLRDDFTAKLLEGIEQVPPDKRIIVDTGGGAVVSFLEEPEDALFMVLHLHQAMQRAYTGEGLGGTMRSCINLGPVVLSRDLNGRPLTVGDGVNAARQIVRAADPGEVLVSRSYCDLISRLFFEHAELFQCAGSRTDEESRAHEVYAIRDCESALRFVKQRLRG